MFKIPSDMMSGTIHPTSKWGDIEIIDYNGNREVLVKFVDSGVTKVTRSELIRKGIVEDVTLPCRFGYGFMGEGPFNSTENKKEHVHWKGLLERSYCIKFAIKSPSYSGVYTTAKWHNFQNFAEWCQTATGFGNKGWELDKDLLIKGNRVYSPETCVFLPYEINGLIVKGTRKSELPIGVTKSEYGYRAYCSDRGKTLSKRSTSLEECFEWYKETKENIIKSMADEYKNELDSLAYEALYNYRVEWGD